MYNKQTTDISREAIPILKTVLMLDRAYGSNYLVQILRAGTKFPLRNVNHQELETYGSLEDCTYGRMQDVIDYLINEAYLEVKNQIYGSLGISSKGEEYLSQPKPLIIELSSLRKAWYEFQLYYFLKELRKEIADAKEVAPYTIFTNFGIRQLVIAMPETQAELDQIPGMEPLEEEVKSCILDEVSQLLEKKAKDEQTGIFTKVYSPSYRKVKELYEAGFEPSEIARRRKIKTRTVEGYLETLHKAGEIDLKPWIEEQIDSAALHKASEYFRQVSTPQLRDAHKVLGLDYETLRMCRLYTAKVEEPILRYAS